MSLLMNYEDQRFTRIAQMVFEEQLRRDPGLESQMDERRRKMMYDDVVYNLSFLMTSVYFSDGRIFEGYARWLYELLCNLMKDLDRDRIMEIMTGHYRIMSEILADHAPDILTGDELGKAAEYLDLAIAVTTEAVTDIELSTSFSEGDYYDIRKAYLDALLRSRTKNAHEIIRDARKQGVPLEHIYEKILRKVMHEIGELWHRNVITVDREHYATSVTQTVMSGFFDEIFESPRKNRTLIACAVGSELHEMGIRMLSDMFEYQGWDTFYLGAALPGQAVVEAIGEHKPDLVALSVTMPPYLSSCEGVVKAIRAAHPGVKIAVGGQAFDTTDELWKKWDIDFYSPSAGELLRWAHKTFAA